MDPHPNFKAMYARAAALGLKPVQTASDVQHAGFDIDEVQKALGAARFAKLIEGKSYTSGVPVGRAPGAIQVFSCGHRSWPGDHAEPHKQNAEVHCIYAQDLEQFLAEE